MAYDGFSERTQRIDAWPETGGEEPQDADRLGIHGLWEGLLAVAVVVVAVGVYQVKSDMLLGTGLQSVLLLAATVGFVAIGASWSLRAAAPNLAVGPVAAASATFFAGQAEGGLWYGVGVTLVAATTIGVLLALIVVVLHVPAWAASVGFGFVMAGWVLSGDPPKPPDGLSYDPVQHALYWFLGFAVLSLAGGLVTVLPPVRVAIGAYRPIGDPEERPGFAAGMSALAALIGSCVLAGVGGMLLVLAGRPVEAGGLGWTGLACAAVLLGGVSVYGRRGGVAGTLLAVLLLTLGLALAEQVGWKPSIMVYAGITLLLGLAVTRLIESLGRSDDRGDDEADWESEDEPGPGRGPAATLPAASSALDLAARPRALPARPGGPTLAAGFERGPRPRPGGTPTSP